MTEMIERVARKLCDDTLKRWRSPIALHREPWREFIPAARAAIEAMRDPTDEMVLAGAKYHDDNWRPSHARQDTNAEAIWQDMIDAATTERVGK